MKLLIGADLVPTDQTEALFVAGDEKTLFGGVAPMMKNADRVLINLECALTESMNAIKKFGPNLKAKPACADTLKAVGVTDVALSNNHVFDFGVKGLQDTMKHLDRVGLPYMGVGENDTLSRKPYFIEQDGVTVGIINVCEHEYTYALPDRMGANPFDPYLTMQDIMAVRSQADYVIVLYHGGKEHCRYPSPRLRKLCQAMVDFGADFVITQHSHCIGCYEKYKGGQIVYGQGNFHFCKNGMRDGWYTSLLLELEIKGKSASETTLSFYPIVSKEDGIDLADEKTREDVLNVFYARSAELENGKWLDGWHEFCLSAKDFYNRVISECTTESTEKQKQFFAHYLDCEAHTDVWKELYPTWNATNEK